jgi:hypothetical protein
VIGLVAFAVLFGGILAGRALGVPQDVLIRVSALSATGLAMIGGVAAARAFAGGDYLRRAWIANAVGSGALFVSAILRVPDPPAWILWTRVGLTAVSNVSSVIGTILFARTYRAAGLSLPISPVARLAVIATTTALAALAAGIPVFDNANAIFSGRGGYGSYIGVISSAGDGIMLALIAPLVMTAWALEGGSLARTFWLLSASYCAWLFFDAQDTVDFFFRLEPDVRSLLTFAVEPFRQLACALLFAAAMAQRAVVREGA